MKDSGSAEWMPEWMPECGQGEGERSVGKGWMSEIRAVESSKLIK